MAFGNLLSSGNVGTEFAKAIAVKVPRSKYSFIEGVQQAQKQKAAKAKAGVAVEDDINKLKKEAANSIKDVDPKVAKEMEDAAYGFLDKTDRELLNSSSAQTALPAVQRHFTEFNLAVANIVGRSNVLKGIRAKSMQPGVITPPSVNRFLNSTDVNFEDDGLLQYPGWRERLVANEQLGWAGMDLPKKKDLSRMDVEILKNQPIAFFKNRSEGAPSVTTKTISGRSFEVTDYKLSREAIREQVRSATEIDQDYKANLSYQYYEANRGNPNFKQETLDLVANNLTDSDVLLDKIIDYRTDQIYRMGVYKGDELSGSKPASVNVTVETGDKAPKPGWSNPILKNTLIRQTLQNREVVDASVVTFGTTIGGSEVNLAGIEGMIDVQGNEKFGASGTFNFTPSQIVLVPVYAKAERANANYDVQGKLVDSNALTSEMLNDNVRFDVFVQGSSTTTFTSGGVSKEGADIFYPANDFWAQNRALSSKTQISLGQEELRIMSEMNALRDMLNDKDQEALLLFKDAVAQKEVGNLQARLVAMAYDKGYMNPYKKGQLFKSPSEVDARGAGPGIQTERPKPQVKKDEAKPANNSAPKAAANKAAAPAKPAGLPTGTPRRTAKRESL